MNYILIIIIYAAWPGWWIETIENCISPQWFLLSAPNPTTNPHLGSSTSHAEKLSASPMSWIVWLSHLWIVPHFWRWKSSTQNIGKQKPHPWSETKIVPRLPVWSMLSRWQSHVSTWFRIAQVLPEAARDQLQQHPNDPLVIRWWLCRPRVEGVAAAAKNLAMPSHRVLETDPVIEQVRTANNGAT